MGSAVATREDHTDYTHLNNIGQLSLIPTIKNNRIRSKLSQKITGIKQEYRNLTELKRKYKSPEIWQPRIVNLYLIKRLPEKHHAEIVNNLRTRLNFTEINTHFICDIELEVDEYFLKDLQC